MNEFFSVEENRNNLKSEILTWLGTPYLHNTAVKKRGVDCSLFIACVYLELNILTRLEKIEYYPKDWYVHTKKEFLLNSIEKYTKDNINPCLVIKKVSKDCLQTGDLLTFRFKSKVLSNHAGLYLGTTFVHSMTNQGVIITGFSDFWKKINTNVYRVFFKER